MGFITHPTPFVKFSPYANPKGYCSLNDESRKQISVNLLIEKIQWCFKYFRICGRPPGWEVLVEAKIDENKRKSLFKWKKIREQIEMNGLYTKTLKMKCHLFF